MEGKSYLQKEGACIGSSVVPILAEIHLNTIDKMVYDKIDAMAQSVGFVRRNFDDIIICLFEDGLSESLEKLVRSAALELQFTVEKPEEGEYTVLRHTLTG